MVGREFFKTGNLTAIALFMGYCGLGCVFLRDYFLFAPHVLMGLALSPYLLNPAAGQRSLRALFLLIPLLALAILLPVKTLYFGLLLTAIVLLIETAMGRACYSFFFLLFFISPLFTYFSTMIGFPLRLWLSSVSATILQSMGWSCSASGNIINMGNEEFPVDATCAGLNMLVVSLILALFIVSYHQRHSGYRSRWYEVAGFLGLAFGLNILSNLFRILALVIFKIPPENLMHDVTGLICLLIYVILPLLVICRWYFKRKKREPGSKTRSVPLSVRTSVMHGALLAVIGCVGTGVGMYRSGPVNKEKLQLAGYKESHMQKGIVKLENAESLIYLKSIDFFAPEHSPAICWRGSGYEFKKIELVKLANKEIYCGILAKGKEEIYTAWWFHSRSQQTCSQWKWRWHAFSSEEKYYLVNVNAASREQLFKVAQRMLKEQF